MPNPIWPTGTVQALLQSDAVRASTKAVLNERMQSQSRPVKRLFDDENFAVLEAVCNCLFPQSRVDKVPLPQMLETILATGPGEGWRYDSLPPINEAIVQGLKGIEAEAQTRFGQTFNQLSTLQQDDILRSVQQDETITSAWLTLRADLFFTELLVRLTELYYSHPFAKDEIGDVSFADAPGWHRIGLNTLEDREPQSLSTHA